MASNFIRLTIVGRVGRDPEMRYTDNGVPVTNFSVAATRRWKDANDAPQERTTWVRVTCWRNLAEVVAKYLQRGRLVAVEAEVIEAVKRGATTLDGIKYRTRAGMGRCQSNFCGLRVIEILARELNVPVDRVTKNGGDSKVLN